MTKRSSHVDNLRDQVHVLEGLAAALARWPEVSAIAFESDTPDTIVSDLVQLLDVDEVQAQAISDMQVRQLARLQRERIDNRLAETREQLAAIERG